MIYAQKGADCLHTSAVEAVSRLGNRPVTIIHGNDDIGMPVLHRQALYDAAVAPPGIWFGRGPHNNIAATEPRAQERRVFAFLEADNHNILLKNNLRSIEGLRMLRLWLRLLMTQCAN